MRWPGRRRLARAGGFDPRLLTLASKVPVSSVLSPEVDPSVGAKLGARWFDLGGGWHAVANSIYGTEEDPGLLAFIWVRWPAVVDLILRQTDPVDQTQDQHPEPDAALLGFAPLTYAAALRHEKAGGRRPMRTASYRIMTDGAFRYSQLHGERRGYYFAPANPEDDDTAIAVMFNLS